MAGKHQRHRAKAASALSLYRQRSGIEIGGGIGAVGIRRRRRKAALISGMAAMAISAGAIIAVTAKSGGGGWRSAAASKKMPAMFWQMAKTLSGSVSAPASAAWPQRNGMSGARKKKRHGVIGGGISEITRKNNICRNRELALCCATAKTAA
jgi:hypothetical protein